MTARVMTLGYEGCRVRVEASEPSDLVWLREFLGPAFDDCSGAASEHQIVLDRDVEKFASLQSRGPHASGRSIGCFALDARIETFPVWNSRDEGDLVFDPTLGAFYSKQAPGRTEIIAEPRNRAARTALFRVVREIVTARVVARHGLVVHGAALAWNGQGYVLVGPKEAGKTTLLLHLLSRTGAALVANDRVVIRADQKPVTLRGMPTIVSVRRSSLVRLPHLETSFCERNYHHRFSLDEAGQGATAASRDGQIPSWSLTPAQLAHLLGASRSSRVPLGALIFPRRTGLPGGLSVEPLPREVAADRLRDGLFRSGSAVLVGDFFADGRPSTSSDRRDALCDELPGRVPCFDCALGLDAYEDPASAHRMLATLIGP